MTCHLLSLIVEISPCKTGVAKRDKSTKQRGGEGTLDLDTELECAQNNKIFEFLSYLVLSCMAT